jgi:hypothetical protein
MDWIQNCLEAFLMRNKITKMKEKNKYKKENFWKRRLE